MTNNTYETNCPKCDSWNVRFVGTSGVEVPNGYGALEQRVYVHYECRDCPTDWKEDL